MINVNRVIASEKNLVHTKPYIMKPQRINHLAIIMFSGMWLLTSCTQGSLVADIEPTRHSPSTTAYSSAGLPEYDQEKQLESMSFGECIEINTRINLLVRRERAEGILQDAIKQEEGTDANQSLGGDVQWAFHLVSTSTMTHDDLGLLSVYLYLQTDPNKKRSFGVVRIVSSIDKSASMTYRVGGPENVEQLLDGAEYPFIMTLTHTSGSFRNAPSQGFASLQTNVDGQIDFKRVIESQLNMTLCTEKR